MVMASQRTHRLAAMFVLLAAPAIAECAEIYAGHYGAAFAAQPRAAISPRQALQACSRRQAGCVVAGAAARGVRAAPTGLQLRMQQSNRVSE